MVRMLGCFVLFSLFSTVVPAALCQDSWQKYDQNPVLGSALGYDPENPVQLVNAMEPSVLYDSASNLFHMWFCTQAPGASSISDAISQDGKTWFVRAHSPVFRGSASWDQLVRSPKVIYDGKQYMMYYTGQMTGNDYHLGLATSSDGIAWQRVSGYPILALPQGSWSQTFQAFCEVLHEDSTYSMWFSGNPGRGAIGLATSKDGINWTVFPGNPVFQATQEGWDSVEVSSPAIVRVNGVLYMFYLGNSILGVHFSLGWAHSTDGIHWSRGSSSPVLWPTGWEVSSFGTLCVLFRGEKFHLWYSALSAYGQWLTGYATSDYHPLSVSGSLAAPRRYSLAQNYPNPFNPTTTIVFEVPSQSNVRIEVYDVLGREVRTLFTGEKLPGRYELSFDAEKIASGTYYCRMTAESTGGAKLYEETRKLVVVK